LELAKSEQCQSFVVQRSEIVGRSLKHCVIVIDSIAELPVLELVICLVDEGSDVFITQQSAFFFLTSEHRTSRPSDAAAPPNIIFCCR
jgi:hypothetical protein